jgi:serine phosphatase RsbU (regulator of sigma subunit)
LQPGDVVFATTDGFPDQFGGPKGKKFMRKRLRELFLEIAPLQPAQQEARLAEVFDAWKGNEPQVDDVLVISVRV